eukprot:TRINITY_DN4405_c0_g3_i2.p1 TRINITY_DN4405_c0_g3~~TRINITY_DN4405_c0_g3_i2.p1  ORF type:complete len:102 (-),score=28.01 TRINITY_DN4405_c0_g3_i2:67-372(-)
MDLNFQSFKWRLEFCGGEEITSELDLFVPFSFFHHKKFSFLFPLFFFFFFRFVNHNQTTIKFFFEFGNGNRSPVALFFLSLFLSLSLLLSPFARFLPRTLR